MASSQGCVFCAQGSLFPSFFVCGFTRLIYLYFFLFLSINLLPPFFSPFFIFFTFSFLLPQHIVSQRNFLPISFHNFVLFILRHCTFIVDPLNFVYLLYQYLMKSLTELPLCVRNSNSLFSINNEQQSPNKRLKTECDPAELEQILCEEQDACIEVRTSFTFHHTPFTTLTSHTN